MLNARIVKHILNFKEPVTTSRGTLSQKQTWYILLHDYFVGYTGIGECAVIPDLSIDDRPDYFQKLTEVCGEINSGMPIDYIDLEEFPSIAFALEMAMADLAYHTFPQNILFPSQFIEGEHGIPINGLVWMASREIMEQQVRMKIQQGFDTIKLKIGALDFEDEIAILQAIRQQFSPEVISIRLDANGAFTAENAMEKLSRLSEFSIHSIEQPIRQGQRESMADLCRMSPISIALDEELIGRFTQQEQEELLAQIKPQYIILKPSLIGGFAASERWIASAAKNDINWWITSALEGNIGLNAIAQWTFTLNNPMPQGLGTGQIYSNNIESPLTIVKGKLYYDVKKKWDLSLLRW
jgi:o-succinylbenzoate synthase